MRATDKQTAKNRADRNGDGTFADGDAGGPGRIERMVNMPKWTSAKKRAANPKSGASDTTEAERRCWNGVAEFLKPIIEQAERVGRDWAAGERADDRACKTLLWRLRGFAPGATEDGKTLQLSMLDGWVDDHAREAMAGMGEAEQAAYAQAQAIALWSALVGLPDALEAAGRLRPLIEANAPTVTARQRLDAAVSLLRAGHREAGKRAERQSVCNSWLAGLERKVRNSPKLAWAIFYLKACSFLWRTLRAPVGWILRRLVWAGLGVVAGMPASIPQLSILCG